MLKQHVETICGISALECTLLSPACLQDDVHKYVTHLKFTYSTPCTSVSSTTEDLRLSTQVTVNLCGSKGHINLMFVSQVWQVNFLLM